MPLIKKAKAGNPAPHTGVADVANREQVDSIIDDALAKRGGLDILVNNGGIAGLTGGVDAIEPDQWERRISTNLNSHTTFCARLSLC